MRLRRATVVRLTRFASAPSCCHLADTAVSSQTPPCYPRTLPSSTSQTVPSEPKSQPANRTTPGPKLLTVASSAPAPTTGTINTSRTNRDTGPSDQITRQKTAPVRAGIPGRTLLPFPRRPHKGGVCGPPRRFMVVGGVYHAGAQADRGWRGSRWAARIRTSRLSPVPPGRCWPWTTARDWRGPPAATATAASTKATARISAP